jgi:hypothetical protein
MLITQTLKSNVGNSFTLQISFFQDQQGLLEQPARVGVRS